MIPFVYLASVCLSLQCLISPLTLGGGGGLLFRFAGSVQSCCGEGGALRTDIAVCGEHSLCSGHTGFAPHRGVCALPVYTAQAPGCSIGSGSSFQVLHKDADLVGPVFCAFQGRSTSGSQEFNKCTLPRCGAPSPLHSPSLRFHVRRPGAPCVSSGELSLANTLQVDVNHPESHEVFG